MRGISSADFSPPRLVAQAKSQLPGLANFMDNKPGFSSDTGDRLDVSSKRREIQNDSERAKIQHNGIAGAIAGSVIGGAIIGGATYLGAKLLKKPVTGKKAFGIGAIAAGIGVAISAIRATIIKSGAKPAATEGLEYKF